MKDLREQGRTELLYKMNQTIRHLTDEVEELSDRRQQLLAELDAVTTKEDRRLQERDLLLSTRDSLYDEDGVWK
jgi:acetyl-CoA carboxylase carboxyltransferase component